MTSLITNTLSIEVDNNHTDFVIFDNDLYEVEAWLEQNGFTDCNGNTELVIENIEQGFENERAYIVLPMNETLDMTIHFYYEA